MASQCPASANSHNEVYPDQSLYMLIASLTLSAVSIIFNDKTKSNILSLGEGFEFAPIIVDVEAGFRSVLNAYELARNLIEAGVPLFTSKTKWFFEKKCGHLGGKGSYSY